MRTINLLPPRFATQRAVRHRRRVWSAACSVIGTGSALTIGVSTAYTPVTSGMEAQLVGLQHDRRELNEQASTLMVELQTQEPGVRLLDSVARQPNWSPLLSQVAHWCAGEAQLEQIDIRLVPAPGSFMMTLVGISTSQEFVGGLVTELRDSQHFSKVTLRGTQRVNQSDPPTFRFNIDCMFSGHVVQSEALR
jgi:hypothetical protein